MEQILFFFRPTTFFLGIPADCAILVSWFCFSDRLGSQKIGSATVWVFKLL